MKKEKEIKELSELLDTNFGYVDEIPAIELATKLYNADYRKQSDVAKEFGVEVTKVERLTMRYESGETNYLKYNGGTITDYHYQHGIDRLAEYEDIGTPQELAQLKSEARLKELKGEKE